MGGGSIKKEPDKNKSPNITKLDVSLVHFHASQFISWTLHTRADCSAAIHCLYEDPGNALLMQAMHIQWETQQ